VSVTCTDPERRRCRARRASGVPRCAGLARTAHQLARAAWCDSASTWDGARLAWRRVSGCLTGRTWLLSPWRQLCASRTARRDLFPRDDSWFTAQFRGCHRGRARCHAAQPGLHCFSRSFCARATTCAWCAARLDVYWAIRSAHDAAPLPASTSFCSICQRPR